MFALTWCGILFGMLVRSPDAVQGMGFIVILPLTSMAGTFVPIARAPVTGGFSGAVGP